MPLRPLAVGLLLAVARFGTVRFRPADSVTNLAFSPDGKRLASWGSGHGGSGERKGVGSLY